MEKEKYERLYNLDSKLEKFVSGDFHILKNKQKSLEEEIKTLKKELSEKISSMKDKGLEDTYAYGFYVGKQEELIEDKLDELNEVESALSKENYNENLTMDNLILFLSNAFKVNIEILKESMEYFNLEEYAEDLLSSSTSESQKNFWKEEIKYTEHLYNSKINCLNLTGKSSCSLDDFIAFNGLSKDFISRKDIYDDTFVELLNSIDPDYKNDFSETEDPENMTLPNGITFLVTFLFRNINDKKTLQNYSFNLSLVAKIISDFPLLYPKDAKCILEKLNTSVIKEIIKANSCKEVLGDLFKLIEKKFDEDVISVNDVLMKDEELKELVEKINQRYTNKAVYIDEDKALSNNGQEYPEAGSGGMSSK